AKRKRATKGALPRAQETKSQVEGDRAGHRRRRQRVQARSAQGGGDRADLRHQDLHHLDRARHARGGGAGRAGSLRQLHPAAAALPGESEIAGGDRRSDRRRALPGDRHGCVETAVSSHFERSAAVQPQGAGAALRRALPDRDHPRGGAAVDRDFIFAHALSEIPMTGSGWGFGHPHLLWLLALVPTLVVVYAFDGQRRRRVLERIGHHTMIARMTASYSPARRRWKAVLTVSAVTLLLGALARPQMP